MTAPTGLRLSERVALLFFIYLSGLTMILRSRPRADARVLLETCIIALSLWLLIAAERRWHPLGFSITRDWWTLALVLAAYRSLNWFAPVTYPDQFEQWLLRSDAVVLEQWRLRDAIESLRDIFPPLLEVCYLLTSAAGGIALAVLYILRKRQRCDCFLLCYVSGTLLAYALIPFFPSRPPRLIFPDQFEPQVKTAIRTFNVLVLSKAGIQTGVFPSAHVSSTFSVAWGMFYCLPERKLVGIIFLVYACLVALATVYGRYHFALDAVAGFAVSIGGLAIARLLFRREAARQSEPVITTPLG